jgi:hypothetical protein
MRPWRIICWRENRGARARKRARGPRTTTRTRARDGHHRPDRIREREAEQHHYLLSFIFIYFFSKEQKYFFFGILFIIVFHIYVTKKLGGRCGVDREKKENLCII